MRKASSSSPPTRGIEEGPPRGFPYLSLHQPRQSFTVHVACHRFPPSGFLPVCQRANRPKNQHQKAQRLLAVIFVT